MGSWDCYCAICGAPFPRSPQNITRRPKTITAQDPGSGDQQSERTGCDETQESDYFDADLVSESDVAWLCTLYALVRCSTGGPRSDKAFITGPGTYDDSAMVEVERGDDPDFDEQAEILCYDGAFPFHWSCYEILGLALASKQGGAGIHKISLYYSLSRLSGVCATSLPRVNYGAAAPINDQFWTEGKGLELTAVDPMLPAADLLANVDLIRDLVSEVLPPKLTSDLSLRVRSDPFQRLSLELIYQLCNYLPVESVFNLMQASWIVHQTVGASTSFWRSRIKGDMPWAFEIQHLLESTGEGHLQGAELELQNWQYKWLYAGLHRATNPKPYLRGSLILLSLANRRRIWHVCTQIKTQYDKTRQY